MARDPGRFSFLARCAPTARIKVGDARLLIEREPPHSADILVLDAFSSDSIPMHLLTLEALRGYGRLLQDRGMLLIHISNRFVDLRPVVAGAAAAGGWHAALRNYDPDAPASARNEYGSQWVALSRSQESLSRLVVDSHDAWSSLPATPASEAWTDDHASILRLISLNVPKFR
jgi:spermidine synthase